jgi:hypothetical protein
MTSDNSAASTRQTNVWSRADHRGQLGLDQRLQIVVAA